MAPLVDIGAFEFQPSTMAGDIDDDGVVGFADLLQLLVACGACPGLCPEDLDDNDNVGFSDLLLVLSAWGPC